MLWPGGERGWEGWQVGPVGKGLLCQGVWDVPCLPGQSPRSAGWWWGNMDMVHTKPPWLWGASPPRLDQGRGFGGRQGSTTGRVLPFAFPAPPGWAGSPVGLTWAGDALRVLGDLPGQGARGWAQVCCRAAAPCRASQGGQAGAAALLPPEAIHLVMQTSKIPLGHLIAAPGGFAANLASLGAMSWVQSGLNPSERAAGFCPRRCRHDLMAATAV